MNFWDKSVMDLGCIDMGCVEKPRKEETHLEKENSSPKESVTSASKLGKNSRKAKDAVRSSLSALTKLTSQISKPPHRKTSPINWFPRKKVEPYLKRKIKMLQERDGMHSTLDETLGDSNPHYSRVLREKIAIREAAEKAMEARKAAMVEASWCRILQAARIDSKEAEAQLSKAELAAAEAFEAAKEVGVIMNYIPDCADDKYQIETSAKGGSTTHTVSATFETAFEVDKQVSHAVKAAFIKLAHCPSINKDEFKELLRKISENPDTDENHSDLSDITSEFESDARSEMEAGKDSSNYQDGSFCTTELCGTRPKKHKKMQESDNFNMDNMVDMMLGRLRFLKEEELASLATIVATSGLSAALAETQSRKRLLSSAIENTENPCPMASRRPSLGGRSARNSSMGAQGRGAAGTELPSLDKFLVKRLTRLEREVLEAKNARKNDGSDVSERKLDMTNDEKLISADNTSSNAEVKLKEGTVVPELGSMLVKHSSKLEKEVEEARKNGKSSEIDNRKFQRERTCRAKQHVAEVPPSLDKFLVKHMTRLEKEVAEARNGKSSEIDNRKFQRACTGRAKQHVAEVPSLDKFLVKHMTRLEKEVEEARNGRKLEPTEGGRIADSVKTTAFLADATDSEEIKTMHSAVVDSNGKENIDVNKIDNGNISTNLSDEDTLSKAAEEVFAVEVENKIHSEPSSSRSGTRVQNRQTKDGGNGGTNYESLDKVLVKHVSRLEKEKMEFCADEQMRTRMKRKDIHIEIESSEGSLDQVLVKHKSRLEREKVAAAKQQEDSTRHSVSRRQARERELHAAWGGLSLGNSMRPHVSRLERDKAAWLKAEEEEKKRTVEEV